MVTYPARSVVTRYDSETLPMIPQGILFVLKGKVRDDVIARTVFSFYVDVQDITNVLARVCVCVSQIRNVSSRSVSCRDEFNIQVLHAFVELHEFTDLNLVQALR